MRHRARPKHLPGKLRALRKRLGLSQSQLAARLSFDVENGRISDYELGKRQPTVLILLDYARLAGIHIYDLVDDDIDLALRNASIR
jgi:transcriptional regulator with XRE-family HTH domain